MSYTERSVFSNASISTNMVFKIRECMVNLRGAELKIELLSSYENAAATLGIDAGLFYLISFLFSPFFFARGYQTNNDACIFQRNRGQFGEINKSSPLLKDSILQTNF